MSYNGFLDVKKLFTGNLDDSSFFSLYSRCKTSNDSEKVQFLDILSECFKDQDIKFRTYDRFYRIHFNKKQSLTKFNNLFGDYVIFNGDGKVPLVNEGENARCTSGNKLFKDNYEIKVEVDDSKKYLLNKIFNDLMQIDGTLIECFKEVYDKTEKKYMNINMIKTNKGNKYLSEIYRSDRVRMTVYFKKYGDLYSIDPYLYEFLHDFTRVIPK